MKNIILLFLLSSINLYGIAFDDVDIDVYGETNYSKQTSENMSTVLNFDYKVKLHEPVHKKYMIYLGGTVSPDYDIFGNEIKLNGFTQLGIEF